MALEIKWTHQANKGLDNVLEYLELNWTNKEILNLEQKLNQVLQQISIFPHLFPKSDIYKNLHKAIIDKNNYLVYRINEVSNSIEIINFRGTKQTPKY